MHAEMQKTRLLEWARPVRRLSRRNRHVYLPLPTYFQGRTDERSRRILGPEREDVDSEMLKPEC